MVLSDTQDKKTEHDRERGRADEHVQPLGGHESFEQTKRIKPAHDC